MISILDDYLKMKGEYVQFFLGTPWTLINVHLGPDGGNRSPVIGHHTMWGSRYCY